MNEAMQQAMNQHEPTNLTAVAICGSDEGRAAPTWQSCGTVWSCGPRCAALSQVLRWSGGKNAENTALSKARHQHP